MMKVAFIKSRLVATNIRAFHFAKPGGFTHTAGQFAQVTLPHDGSDERGEVRWFTLTASPTEDDLFITTKFYEKPSTFKQHLRRLKKGDTLAVSEPDGDFVLPKEPADELVFVAGGIGVTPYRSIVKFLRDTGDTRYRIHLLYAATQADEFAFRDLFDSGLDNFRVTYMVREPAPDWDGAVGLLSGKKIDELAEGVMNKLVYLSGPEIMVETLEQQLRSAGQPEDRIKTDFFPNYPDY